MPNSNDEQLAVRLKSIATRLQKANAKAGTRERALAITSLEVAVFWLEAHVERNPDALV